MEKYSKRLYEQAGCCPSGSCEAAKRYCGRLGIRTCTSPAPVCHRLGGDKVFPDYMMSVGSKTGSPLTGNVGMVDGGPALCLKLFCEVFVDTPL